MVTICQRCGDRGFSVALIYCKNCEGYAVHRYCLDVLPVTFEEYVTWFCEGCEPNVVKPSALNCLSQKSDIHETSLLKHLKKKKEKKKKKKKKTKKKSKDEKKRNRVDISLANSNLHINEGNPTLELLEADSVENCDTDENRGRMRELNKDSFSDGVQASLADQSNILEDNLSSIPVRTSECETLNVVEETSPIKCSKKKRKCSKKRKNVVKSMSNSKLCTNDGSPSLPLLEVHSIENLDTNEKNRRNCEESFNDGIKFVEVKTSQVATSECQHIGEENLSLDDVQEKNGIKGLKKKKRKSVISSPDNSEINIGRSSASTLLEVDFSQYCVNDEKLARERGQELDISGMEAKSAINTNTPEDCCYLRAQPIIDPIWRGSLHLCNYSLGAFSELEAHLSSLACSKVYEEAKLFPEQLSFELLPKKDIWPKKFEKRGPSDDSIALYFFAGKESVEKHFDNLVHYLNEEDFGMRATVKNAELLLFTSNALPSHMRSLLRRLDVEHNALSFDPLCFKALLEMAMSTKTTTATT